MKKYICVIIISAEIIIMVIISGIIPNMSNTESLDNIIAKNVDYIRNSRKAGYFVTNSGFPIDRENYVNLSYVYSDEEIKRMSDEEIVRKGFSVAFLYKEFNYRDDIDKYEKYSCKNKYQNTNSIRRMTRNRAIELAVKEVDYKGNDIKIYYDDINEIFKTVMSEDGYAYFVYCDTYGITLNVFKIPMGIKENL